MTFGYRREVGTAEIFFVAPRAESERKRAPRFSEVREEEAANKVFNGSSVMRIGHGTRLGEVSHDLTKIVSGAAGFRREPVTGLVAKVHGRKLLC